MLRLATMSGPSTSHVPVPLIQIDSETNKLMVCQQGLDCLTSNNKRTPLCVLAVAGLYRTGKSFLLNRIVSSLRSLSTTTTSTTTTSTTTTSTTATPPKFPVGTTTEACTRGIWIWDPNIKLRGGARLILLDSEGLASLDQDEQHDAQIFCLALLLSSFFILNTQGVIDEAAIDRLYVVGEITKRVCVASSKKEKEEKGKKDEKEERKEKEEEALSEHFPPFMWLLRDFHLSLEREGRTLSTSEYLEQSLSNRSTKQGRRSEERNDTRRAVRSLFRRRQCFTMVRPALDEEGLRNAGGLNDEHLRPEFVQQLQSLCTILQEEVPRKRCLGTDVDGIQLGELAKRYVEAMNNGAVPEIKGTWEHVVERTYSEARVRCSAMYKEKMREKCTFQTMFQNDGHEGYLERPVGKFYSRFEEISEKCVRTARSSFVEMTRGCATTSLGARRDEVERTSLFEEISLSKREFIREMEESSRTLTRQAMERMLAYCQHESETMEGTLDCIERASESFRRESVALDKTVSSSFTPTAVEIMSSVWPQRIFPLLRTWNSTIYFY